MKRTVKPLVLITIAALLSVTLPAQLKLPLGNSIAKELRSIIEDFPNHFSNISSDIITEANGAAVYTCKTSISGAEESSVTKHAGNKPVYSWQATMLTTENFEKAKQKFKALYGQINNLSIHLWGDAYKLKGVYVSPAEEMKFTSVVFKADAEKEEAKKLRVELLLQSSAPMELKIKLLVYEKEREDDERGAQREGE